MHAQTIVLEHSSDLEATPRQHRHKELDLVSLNGLAYQVGSLMPNYCSIL
jgi:hypothetical protein